MFFARWQTCCPAGPREPGPAGLRCPAGARIRFLPRSAAGSAFGPRALTPPRSSRRSCSASFAASRLSCSSHAIQRPPSEYFYENIYVTYQDDQAATANVDERVLRRVMWANDFPHSDSTWPWSMEILGGLTGDLTQEQRDWILHDNVAELYGLDA